MTLIMNDMGEFVDPPEEPRRMRLRYSGGGMHIRDAARPSTPKRKAGTPGYCEWCGAPFEGRKGKRFCCKSHAELARLDKKRRGA